MGLGISVPPSDSAAPQPPWPPETCLGCHAVAAIDLSIYCDASFSLFCLLRRCHLAPVRIFRTLCSTTRTFFNRAAGAGRGLSCRTRPQALHHFSYQPSQSERIGKRWVLLFGLTCRTVTRNCMWLRQRRRQRPPSDRQGQSQTRNSPFQQQCRIYAAREAVSAIMTSKLLTPRRFPPAFMITAAHAPSVNPCPEAILLAFTRRTADSTAPR